MFLALQLHPIIQHEGFKHFVRLLFTSSRAIEFLTMLTLGGPSDVLCQPQHWLASRTNTKHYVWENPFEFLQLWLVVHPSSTFIQHPSILWLWGDQLSSCHDCITTNNIIIQREMGMRVCCVWMEIKYLTLCVTYSSSRKINLLTAWVQICWITVDNNNSWHISDRLECYLRLEPAGERTRMGWKNQDKRRLRDGETLSHCETNPLHWMQRSTMKKHTRSVAWYLLKQSSRSYFWLQVQWRHGTIVRVRLG